MMSKEELAKIVGRGESELKALADEAEKWVSSCLEKGDCDGWSPKLMISTFSCEQGNAPDFDTKCDLLVVAIVGNFTEEEEKRGALTEIGRKLWEEKQFPVACLLTSEAWSVTRRKGDNNDLEPRHDPMRRECIIISGTSATTGLAGKPATQSELMVVRDVPDGPMKPDPDSPKWSRATGGYCNILKHFWRGVYQKCLRDMAQTN